MASLSTLAWKFASRNCRALQKQSCLYKCRYSSTTTDAESVPATTDEEVTDSESTENIEDLRNVSQLSSNHYLQYHGQPPELHYKDLHRRKMLYAQFGSASGEDPRILWPSREKLLDQELEEKEEGQPLLERLAQIQLEKKAAEKAKIERHKMIAQNMSKMPGIIAAYKKKQKVAEDEARERAAKKEALLEEARDYFGYKIQANDPKFQEMLLEKEEKEKKEAKKRKKEEKMQKQAARLQEEAAKLKIPESKTTS